MGFRWNTKNFSPIGIDFGSDSVKALQVTLDDPPQVVAAACADIPGEARKDADAQRRFIADALRDMLVTGRFKGKRVVASISAAQSYTQHLRLGRAEGEALNQQIEAELRGCLPLDPSMLVVRHVHVGEVFADGASKQEVICLAAGRDYVMRNVQMVRAAGFEVVGMHCEPMAILQSFAHLFRRVDDSQRTTLFVDIGAATTKALISHGKDLVFAKTIHVAGDHFVRQLGDEMRLGLDEARLMHIRRAGGRTDQGLAVVEGGTAVATAPDPRGPEANIGEPDAPGEMLETLIDELHLCIGYHASMFQERKVEKAVFLGGESRQTRLCQRIAQALKLPAQLGDPLARLVRPGDSQAVQGMDLRQSQPGWAVPLGLCLLPTNL